MKLPHEGAQPMWVPYVKVEKADDVASRVGPLGGQLLLPPMDVPQVGRVAMLLDPLGAALGFITPVVTA
jgi:predicted enzyme related to lactoylglutathione lyase